MAGRDGIRPALRGERGAGRRRHPGGVAAAGRSVAGHPDAVAIAVLMGGSQLRIDAARSLDEVRLILDWAAAEGWNPGLHDAEAFLAADPEGFLLGRLDGEP